MKDKTLPDNEIVKALECCNKNDCRACPYGKYNVVGWCCMPKARKDALDLINRLQAENEELVGNIDRLKEENSNLIVEFQAMRNAANGFKKELFNKTELLKTAKAEIERLKEIIEYKDICIEACEEAKSEAVKEFAERLKQFLVLNRKGEMSVISFDNIENLVKEMVGENNDR